MFIVVQGEGEPTLRKGTCANHIRDISKVLTGAHLTINARTEDDVETDRIIDKVAAVSSAYSFNQPRGNFDDGTLQLSKSKLRTN